MMLNNNMPKRLPLIRYFISKSRIMSCMVFWTDVVNHPVETLHFFLYFLNRILYPWRQHADEEDKGRRTEERQPHPPAGTRTGAPAVTTDDGSRWWWFAVCRHWLVRKWSRSDSGVLWHPNFTAISCGDLFVPSVCTKKVQSNVILHFCNTALLCHGWHSLLIFFLMLLDLLLLLLDSYQSHRMLGLSICMVFLLCS